MTSQEEDSGARNKDNDGDLDPRFVATVIAVFTAGVLSIPVFALQAASIQSFASITAVGMAVAGASLLSGSLVGFLFGIPRRLQQADSEKIAAAPGAEKDEDRERDLYGANTNLEQISDWLTKILVGVGLTQLPGIGAALKSAGTAISPGLGDFSSSSPFAMGIIIFFLVSGFLIGYLWTRLYLGKALTDAELRKQLSKKDEQLSKKERQNRADALALSLARQQLSDEGDRPTQEQLDAALKNASYETRAHIFYRAQAVRENNWRHKSTKSVMERTIALFRALANSDAANSYHRNFGQLGYALKDKVVPDYAAAEAAFDKAIDIRDAKQLGNWNSYEFNRAICRIGQDERYLAEKKSAGDGKERILADLRVALGDPWVRGWAEEDKTIQKWLEINKLNLDDIRPAPEKYTEFQAEWAAAP